MSDRPAAEVSVVGAGGIGCALGHALRAGGVDMTFVETNEPSGPYGFQVVTEWWVTKYLS